MEPESHLEPPAHQYIATYDVFWPVLLMGLSLVLVFSWEIWVGVMTRQSAQNLREQQMKTVERANQVQTGLEKLVRGLTDLAKTDEKAQKLVTKFGIKVNNPTVPESTPAP